MHFDCFTDAHSKAIKQSNGELLLLGSFAGIVMRTQCNIARREGLGDGNECPQSWIYPPSGDV